MLSYCLKLLRKFRLRLVVIFGSLVFSAALLLISFEFLLVLLTGTFSLVNNTGATYWVVKNEKGLVALSSFSESQMEELSSLLDDQAEVVPLQIGFAQFYVPPEVARNERSSFLIDSLARLGFVSSDLFLPSELSYKNNQITQTLVISCSWEDLSLLGFETTAELGDIDVQDSKVDLLVEDLSDLHGTRSYRLPSGVQKGTEVVVNGQATQVKGHFITNGVQLLDIPLVVIADGTLQSLVQGEGKYSHILIYVHDSVEEKEVFDSIKLNFPEMKVLQRENYALNLFRETLFLPSAMLLLSVLFIILIAVLVSVFASFYIFSLEQEQEYGMLRALGLPEGRLILLVLIQAFFIGTIAFMSALGLVSLIMSLVGRFSINLVWEPGIRSISYAYLSYLLAIFLAIIFPILRVIHSDPMLIFKRK